MTHKGWHVVELQHIMGTYTVPQATASMINQNVPSENSDQTAQMHRLIRILAGCTYLKVYCLMVIL